MWDTGHITLGIFIYANTSFILIRRSFEMSEVEKKFERWIKNKGFEYLKKGWPDYLVYGKGEVLFVEVKNPYEPPRFHQMKMHKILKDLGLRVKIATPKEDGFELRESGFTGLDEEDLKLVKGIISDYKKVQDKLRNLGIILEEWAAKHNLLRPPPTFRLRGIWMSFILDKNKKPYEQPNFYISFSDRLTGKLHAEVGLHFRNIEGVDNFSDRVIETIMGRKEEFMSLLATNRELSELELFLASRSAYKKVEGFMLSELTQEKLANLQDTYRKHKDVRVIFMKMYEPQEIIALGDKFSEQVARNFESLYAIFNFLDVKPERAPS